MGLRDLVQKTVRTAMLAVGDIAEDAYYYQYSSANYDASSGVVSAGVTGSLVSMVFHAYEKREIDNVNILPTDLKGIVDQLRFGIAPTNNDYVYKIESGVSVKYEVQGFTEDPAAAHFEFHLRKA